MRLTPFTGLSSPGHIEPTICFSKEKIKIGDNYPLEKLPVTELVKKDQVLVEFTDTDLQESNTLQRRPVIAGVNAYLSEDTNQVLASVVGYPKIVFCSVEDSEEKALEVSVAPLFHLSKDRMEAFIIIQPLLYNYVNITSEFIYKLLTISGIVYGIEYRQLIEIKEHIRKRRTDPERILLARGKKPVPGFNAYLKFKLKIGPIAGTLLKDGSIDFRERKIMVPVSADQIIAVKVPPTKGEPGITVLGETIDQRPGRDIEIKTSNEAYYSPEKRQVIATSDGVLSVVRDNVIMVSTKQEIPGDIDYSTGNIESRNSVVIHGSVLPGFQVKTGGDLEIRGSVMATQVTSLANIVIKGGITGNASSVTASGDVDFLFIEQGHIHCNGNCVIRKQSYYSYISAGGDIRCKELCTVVGGELIAEGNISLGDAGASGADPVFIAAGVIAERIYLARKIQQRLKDYKESIIQRLKGEKGIARSKKMRRLEGGFEALRLHYCRINMIPGTKLNSRSPQEEAETVLPIQSKSSTTEDQKDREDVEINNISIDVHGTIFAGTLLQIGNHTLTVENTLSKQRFILDDTRSHIIAIPLC